MAVNVVAPPPAEAVVLAGDTVIPDAGVAAMLMVVESVTPLTVAEMLTVRSTVKVSVGEVYVTVVPVVLESDPTAEPSAQVTVPVPFRVAVKPWVLPPAPTYAGFGEMDTVVAGGGGGVDTLGIVMVAVSCRFVP